MSGINFPPLQSPLSSLLYSLILAMFISTKFLTLFAAVVSVAAVPAAELAAAAADAQTGQGMRSPHHSRTHLTCILGTFYATGLGACGITNNDGQDIAAVSHQFFDTYP